ncbi:hypothetical protein PL11201_530067 [Planktothrix sp. PCC 11201]|nr:hypothetical protein PL11201_530067 [Planktothrix sp. PCC 11201]
MGFSPSVNSGMPYPIRTNASSFLFKTNLFQKNWLPSSHESFTYYWVKLELCSRTL